MSSGGGPMSQADKEYFARQEKREEEKNTALKIDLFGYKGFYGKCFLGEFEPGDDGYFYYWPTLSRRGCFSQEVIKAIFDTLERLNKDWDDQVRRDMEKCNGK